MTNPLTTHSRAFRWSAVALVAAIVADLAETLVDPANSDDSTKLFDAASQHPGRMIASAYLLLATSLLIVPGVFGLVRTLADRGRRIGRVASCLALFGALGHAALAMLYLVWVQAPKGGSDPEQMVALFNRITDAGPTMVMLPLIVAFPFSLLLLFVAMIRARVIPRWVLLPVAAAPVAAMAAPGGTVVATGTALILMLLAAGILATRGLQRSRPSRTTATATAVA